MEEILKQILNKLDTLEQGQNTLMQGQNALEQGQIALVQRQNALEQGQNALIQRQSSLEQGQNALMQGQSALEQGQNALVQRQSALEQGQNGLMQGQISLEQGQNSLKDDMNELKAIVGRIESRQEIIFNQTANLTEYHTETMKKLDVVNDNISELKETNKSMLEMYGQHEADIRTMRRKLG
jgi:chromosome segregation ATPase